MRQFPSWQRRALVALAVTVLLVVGIGWLYLAGPLGHPPPGCTATLSPAGDPDGVQAYSMTPEQADNAATIAAVGLKLGLPSHAVTVAIATALQESGLHNLSTGDRDSVGLFQQRPSQGWGTVAQISDPVYAATAFYQRLRQQPNWTRLEVTRAAQLVQRSAAPEAYAQWEPQARAIAAALTGEDDATLSCHDLKLGPPADYLVTVARRELGTANLSGPQPPDRGRALASWLVAHSARLGIDRVTLDGNTWTAESGEWTRTGPPDGQLSLHQLAPPA
ncbi:MAG TPA: hypothetical protein VH141_30840 [Pseudonocardia sp.]|nr:hypothetical protein [Pseudonocardia sp.]